MNKLSCLRLLVRVLEITVIRFVIALVDFFSIEFN